MKRICVFCGSNPGRNPYRAVARDAGKLIAGRGLGLVYGGGSIGLMGIVADAALAEGGEVVGVIPEALASAEVAHAGLTELRVVPTMHARKALMVEISDAFMILPGGFGTLDETFEVVTWAQLGIHRKPVGLVNVEGYFDTLLAFLDRAVEDGLISSQNRKLLQVAKDTRVLLEALVGS